MVQFLCLDFGGAPRGGYSKREIQLEITPYDKANCVAVTLFSLGGNKMPFILNSKSTCEEVKTMIRYPLGGLRENAYRGNLNGRQLDGTSEKAFGITWLMIVQEIVLLNTSVSVR